MHPMRIHVADSVLLVELPNLVIADLKVELNFASTDAILDTEVPPLLKYLWVNQSPPHTFRHRSSSATFAVSDNPVVVVREVSDHAVDHGERNLEVLGNIGYSANRLGCCKSSKSGEDDRLPLVVAQRAVPTF